MFSTVLRVRGEAWFVWNTNIADSYIEWYQKQGYWMVVSYTSAVYSIADFVGANFIWSQAESVLQRAEELISAWYLLIDQYWNNDLWGWKTGWDRVNEWKALLLAISTWDMRLVWNDWEEFDRKTKSTSWSIGSGWFTESANKFSVDDIY